MLKLHPSEQGYGFYDELSSVSYKDKLQVELLIRFGNSLLQRNTAPSCTIKRIFGFFFL